MIKLPHFIIDLAVGSLCVERHSYSHKYSKSLLNALHNFALILNQSMIAVNR